MLHATLAAASPDSGLTGWIVQVMDAIGAPGVGLLVGLENVFPPLPSEVILPLAGFSAGMGSMSLVGAILWATLGSVVGAWVLYGVGRSLGRDRIEALLRRMPLIDVDDMLTAERFFVRHGTAAVLLGRLVPGVRSFISIPAGMEAMPMIRFTILTALGSLGWNTALILAGYSLGERYDLVARYLGYVQYALIAVVAVFVVRYLVKLIKRRRTDGTSPATADAGPRAESGR